MDFYGLKRQLEVKISGWEALESLHMGEKITAKNMIKHYQNHVFTIAFPYLREQSHRPNYLKAKFFFAENDDINSSFFDH